MKNTKTVLKTITLLIGIVIVSLITACGGCKNNKETKEVRIGWQSAWATQGQLAQVLQHTNALELMGLKGDFKSFTYGAPLSEAASAGELDVAFMGDQPAINLISKNKDWKVVGRLMDFRVAIVVPSNSSIQTIADLKGKTLGIPYGSSTHRVALQMIKDARLDAKKDLKIKNIDILEQNDIVNAGGDTAWSKVDAFASWDHYIALYENKGYARILKSGTALGVVVMSNKFINENPESAEKFMAAFKLAYYYYALHQDQADKWFADATSGKFDIKLLHKVAEIEPNLKAKEIKDVDIKISDLNKTNLQNAADFAYKQNLIKENVVIDSFIENELVIKCEEDKLISDDVLNKFKENK